ncbi:hypothetical protein KUL49_26010 [Alteromonas sp. KUL49]|nr:hypothetical protein KUL49_26010 [Alteromonas sp. KUL49]
MAIGRQNGPSALVFSRQALMPVDRSVSQVKAIENGGYILRDSVGTPSLIIMATGSEVSLALAAANVLGNSVRVVSMPSTSLFDQQPDSYREKVLPSSVENRIAVEAAHEDFWRKYVGLKGKVLGMKSFGESAPGNILLAHFGFTLDTLVGMAEELLNK